MDNVRAIDSSSRFWMVFMFVLMSHHQSEGTAEQLEGVCSPRALAVNPQDADRFNNFK